MARIFLITLISIFLLISAISCSETTEVMLNSIDVTTHEVVLTAANPYYEVLGVVSLVAESWYMIIEDSPPIYRGRAEDWDRQQYWATLWEGEWFTIIELIGFGRSNSSASFALFLTDYPNVPSEEKSATIQIIGGGTHPTIQTMPNHHTITIRFVPD